MRAWWSENGWIVVMELGIVAVVSCMARLLYFVGTGR